MIESNRFQFRIRDFMIVTAVVSCAIMMARMPVVWQVLDARRNGWACAVLRYLCLWLGFNGVIWLEPSVSRRFFGYGWVLLTSFAILFFFSHLHLGIEPDLAAMFNGLTIVLVIVFWIVGGVIGPTPRKSTLEVEDV